jgi:NADH:ubiquinone oxidoreductase subunit 2 (subunit N)
VKKIALEHDYIDILINAYSYSSIYNISLITLLFFFTHIKNTLFKTIYSFAQFGYNPYFTNSTAIILFSIAGIPPFIGFFSKLLILLTLVSSFFIFFFIFFFVLLFFGLYFYLQNLRFLYSTVVGVVSYTYIYSQRTHTSFFLIINFSLIFIIFGFIIFDDILLYFSWLFV